MGLPAPSPFIHRVRLRQYRSIAACDVVLGSLALLVGPNGSGKSNFLDSLALIADALRGSLDQALRSRGGLRAVQHVSPRASGPLEIAVEFQLAPGCRGDYAFAVAALPEGGFQVLHEACSVPVAGASERVGYEVEKGQVVSWKNPEPPAVLPDRLFLGQASGAPEFRPVFDALSRMNVYRLDPDRLLKPAEPDEGTALARDGGNLASVVRRLRSEAPERLERIETYLRVILPAFRGVEAVSIGGFETLEFTLDVEGREQRFPVASISDGTLRALTLLVSALSAGAMGSVSLVGVEEPEKAIHPAATAAMADAFFEASRSVQVVVTTHSPELLDHDVVDARDLIAVVSEDGVTRLGALDSFGLSALRDRLCTPGELQRQGHLLPRTSLAER